MFSECTKSDDCPENSVCVEFPEGRKCLKKLPVTDGRKKFKCIIFVDFSFYNKITVILTNALNTSKSIYTFLLSGHDGSILKNSFLHEVIDSIQEHPRNSIQQKIFHTKDNTTFVNLTLSSHVIHKQVVRPVQRLKTSSSTSSTSTTTTTTLLEQKDNITFINLTLVGQVIHKPVVQTPIRSTESTTTSTSTTTTSTTTTSTTTTRASTKLTTTLPVKTTTGMHTSF